MSDKIAVVRELLSLIDQAHNTADPTAIRRRIFEEILADDLVYQNHPQRAVRGKQDFTLWQREFAAVEAMTCEIIRAAVVGDWVLTERRDTWTIGGVEVSTPLMGSFEVGDDGKVHAWIDYLPYTEAWAGSGQMRPGFFTEWANDEQHVRTANPGTAKPS